MKFRPGDLVQCAEVIQFLEYDKVYTVEVVGRDSEGSEFQQIRLLNTPGWYSANRFKLKAQEGSHNAINYSLTDNIGTPITYVGTTASKNDQTKVDLSLIPQIALKEEAKAFMVGEKKYGRYNYTKGHKASQLIAAAVRHLTAYNDGEDHDPVDGQHHLGSVRACCAMILRQLELGTHIDDRFKKEESYESP